MLGIRFVASIVERDIDLLVLEELSVSDEFREWLSCRVFTKPVFHSHIGSWHSVTDVSLGESDIVYMFHSADNKKLALLIENKISADAQQEQGARYEARGKNGIESKTWDEFRTCILAPARYLENSEDAKNYHCLLTYEEVLAYFSARRFRDERYAYKARVFLEAIEQNRRHPQSPISVPWTAFAADYFRFAQQKYEQLGMQSPKPRPAGNTWVMFYPAGYPKNVSLCHQVTSGYAKLFFNGARERSEEIRQQFAPYLPERVTISDSGRSVVLSMRVPKLDPRRQAFEAATDDISKALSALQQLDELFRSQARTSTLP
ncbi:PD-(D/E)XK nuclease family protein [Trinickia acidisoli]|uniref:PD-(D/E)XK nuclease family protein n=1 Tax=Trinickia acidisoli TaxID=2767482 RepID=UPI001A8C5ACD|nr:PD-(D/E)XK nuclease family protein [Trinickia acidisoli]